MNWLAHFALSPADGRVRLGNWLPDLLSLGEVAGVADLQVQRGISLHRIIDQTTDHHPRGRVALGRLPPELRRGGRIILDVFWDHFLSCEFAERMNQPLEPFVAEVLQDLARNLPLAPAGVEPVLARMAAEGWLTSYGTVEGVELALIRISRRLSPRARTVLAPRVAGEFLSAHHAELQADFAVIWRDLEEVAVQETSRWLTAQRSAKYQASIR